MKNTNMTILLKRLAFSFSYENKIHKLEQMLPKYALQNNCQGLQTTNITFACHTTNITDISQYYIANIL